MLHNRLDQGGIFGEMGLLMDNRALLPATAPEDTLVYLLPEKMFNQLVDNYEDFSDFAELEDRARLHQAVRSTAESSPLITSKVTTLLSREAVVVPQTETVQQAAHVMAEENISALLVNDPEMLVADGEDGDDDSGPSVSGILTERDLSRRVLAAGLPPQTLVKDVMSTELVSLDHNSYVFEAMMTMLRNKRPVAIIEVSDIVRYESQNSLLFVPTAS